MKEGQRNRIHKEDLTHSIMVLSADEYALKEYSLYLAKVLMCESETPCNNCVQCQKIEHNNHADVMIHPREKESIAVDEVLSIVDRKSVV